MTRIPSVDRAHQWKRTRRLTPTESGGVGWLALALMLSLSFSVVQCGGNSISSDATGGVSTSSGGVSSAGGNASGGTNATGGAQPLGSGGGSVVTGAGGTGGTLSSTSSGGTAPIGGAGGKSSTGGVAPTGGSGAVGGTTTTGTAGKSSTGGATSAGGAIGTAGKSSTGGAIGKGGATGTGGAIGTAGKSSTGGTVGAGGAAGSSFELTSPGWTNMAGCSATAKTSCAPLPTEITRSGAGTSPELDWSGAPAGTKSFVVLFQDISGPSTHWVLWNIAPTVTSLPANIDQTTATPAIPAGSQQCGKGADAATTNGYYGPGAPCNVYEFTVYALSIATFSPTTPTDQEAVRTQLQALGSSILGTASLRGRTNTGC